MNIIFALLNIVQIDKSHHKSDRTYKTYLL